MKKIEEVNLLDIFDELQSVKPKKSFYLLPAHIKENISKNIDNVKRVLKDDKDASNYMLKEIISSYTEQMIDYKINKWIGDNYCYKIPTSDSNDLLDANSTLVSFITCYHYYVTDMLKHGKSGLPFGQYHSAIKDSIAHEVIVESGLPSEDVLALGEIYEEVI